MNAALMELADRLAAEADRTITHKYMGGDKWVNAYVHVDSARSLMKEAATQLRTAASGVGEASLDDELARLRRVEDHYRALMEAPPGAEARDAYLAGYRQGAADYTDRGINQAMLEDDARQNYESHFDAAVRAREVPTEPVSR